MSKIYILTISKEPRKRSKYTSRYVSIPHTLSINQLPLISIESKGMSGNYHIINNSIQLSSSLHDNEQSYLSTLTNSSLNSMDERTEVNRHYLYPLYSFRQSTILNPSCKIGNYNKKGINFKFYFFFCIIDVAKILEKNYKTKEVTQW